MGQATGRASFTRCLLVLLAVTSGTVTLVARLQPDLVALGRAVPSGAPFDEVLVQVCEVAIAGCGAWLWLATAVVALDAARGRWARRSGVPVAVRRVVLMACGVALVGGLGAPAHAGDAAVARRVREVHQANHSVIGTDPDLIRPDQRLRMPPRTWIREEHR